MADLIIHHTKTPMLKTFKSDELKGVVKVGHTFYYGTKSEFENEQKYIKTVTKVKRGGFEFEDYDGEELNEDFDENSTITITNFEPTDVADIETGDVITNPQGSSGDRKVLARVGEMVALSNPRDFENYDVWSSIPNLRKYGWKPKNAPAEVEVTMADVCAKFGQNVKIKKED